MVKIEPKTINMYYRINGADKFITIDFSDNILRLVGQSTNDGSNDIFLTSTEIDLITHCFNIKHMFNLEE